MLQVSVDSVPAGIASIDGLDVHRHDVVTDKLAADGRYFRKCVLYQM